MKTRREVLLQLGIVLLALLVYLPGLGSSAYYQGDEAYYLFSSMKMLENGDWLTPLYRYEHDVPRFQKPPLFYWLVALSYRIGGVSFLTGRLPSLVAAALVLLFSYRLGLLVFRERRTAIAVPVILATMPVFISFARVATTDMVMTLFILLAIYCFCLGFNRGGKRSSYLLCAFFSALAFMTKGPVAFLIIVLSIAGVAFANRKRRGAWQLLRPLFSSWNLLLFLLITCPWYIYMLAEHGGAFSRQLLRHEVAGRLAGPADVVRNLAYYLDVVFRYLLPWSLLLLVFLGRPARRAWPGRILIASYLLLPLAFYALCIQPPSYRYLLPLAVPAALLAARCLAHWRELSAPRGRLLVVLSRLVAGVLLLAGVTSILAVKYLPGPAMLLAASLFAGGGAALFLLRRRRLRAALAAVAAALLAAVVIVDGLVMARMKPEPLSELASAFAAQAPAGASFGGVALDERSRVFLDVHAGKVTRIHYTHGAFDHYPDFISRLGLRNRGEAVYLVMPEDLYHELTAAQQALFTSVARAFSYDLKGAMAARQLVAALRRGETGEYLEGRKRHLLLLRLAN